MLGYIPFFWYMLCRDVVLVPGQTSAKVQERGRLSRVQLLRLLVAELQGAFASY